MERKKYHPLAEKVVKRELSPVEILESYLRQVEELNPTLNAYITICEEKALAQAREIEKKIKANEETGVLAGVPVAIKDNISTKGILTTCASRMLKNFVPVFDATVIEKLKKEDAIIFGKTNMDEFAMGSSTENSAFGPSRNPWDHVRAPGGSSGGSAVAVAGGLAPLALGSDTGGSIRQPAAFCGVVGLKPTYGLVSRYGLVAFASSLDQIGPMASSVAECALLLGVIAGHDPRDSTSYPYEVPDYSALIKEIPEDLRVGVVREISSEAIDEEVRKVFDQALRKLEEAGVAIDEVSLPSFDHALSAYYLIAPAEASSNLARYDGVRYGYRDTEANDIWQMYAKTRAKGFGAEVKRRIMLGTYALSAGYYEAYYGQAQKVRTLIIEDFNRAFEKFDLLVSPTAPSTPFKLGEKVDDPLKMYLSDICTIPVNLAGLPAISLPAGLSDGLPVGFQIIGPAFSEPLIFQLARLAEEAFSFPADAVLKNLEGLRLESKEAKSFGDPCLTSYLDKARSGED